MNKTDYVNENRVLQKNKERELYNKTKKPKIKYLLMPNIYLMP